MADENKIPGQPYSAPIAQDPLQKLQEEKLRAEIRNLTRPSYTKIEFWSFVTTATIAGVTAFILYKNGVFDFQAKMLETTKVKLEYDISHLEHDKKEFEKDTANYSRIKEKLRNENIALSEDINALRITLDRDSSLNIYYQDLAKAALGDLRLKSTALSKSGQRIYQLQKRERVLSDSFSYYKTKAMGGFFKRYFTEHPNQ